jgi:cytoskeletal protein CcmA (bactofilin family)
MNEKKAALESLEVSHNIVIGQGVTFVGSISARGKAFINGKVTGDMSVDDLHVGKSGVIKGKIKSREMDIHGEIHEDVSCAEHVLIHSTGLINGPRSKSKCNNFLKEIVYAKNLPSPPT